MFLFFNTLPLSCRAIGSLEFPLPSPTLLGSLERNFFLPLRVDKKILYRDGGLADWRGPPRDKRSGSLFGYRNQHKTASVSSLLLSVDAGDGRIDEEVPIHPPHF